MTVRNSDHCAVGGEPLPLDRPIFKHRNGYRCDFHDQLAAAGELEIVRLREQAAIGVVQHEVHDD